VSPKTAEVYENPEGWRYRVQQDGNIIGTGVLYADFVEVIKALHEAHPMTVITKVDPLPGQVGIP
jgi:hypothetical protein